MDIYIYIYTSSFVKRKMSSIPITMQNKILITEEVRVSLVKGGDGQTLHRTHR